ncbi:hypothetical protein GXP67_05090 [Rhodocytophaga rosea]|uniref:DUF4386 family protein n=1 Tax=Rhodocytophaga rosea TaxID=2704465 RepID=A0A6C0GDP8_9BACT|nr:hypothetical protein [Rhodocytophaga rosea]QHT66086.1 hypothetical protein GXP67_05090 [Rhodocytophaga rosea]
MQPIHTSIHPLFRGISLIIAPLLFGASTFFWESGEYGITGGTLLALSLVFWIMAFIVLFDLLKEKMPVYATIGLLVAIYGCVSGINFGFVGVFSEVFNIDHDTYLKAAAEHPLSFNLLLFWSGPLFPLSLLVLGIMLIRKAAVPMWAGILICLGAIAFPVSRILRIELIAHISDALLAIPFIFIGWQYITTKHANNFLNPEKA